MFYSVTTQKGEVLCVNGDKILFVCKDEKKNCAVLVMEDGLSIPIRATYEDFLARICCDAKAP